MRRSPHRPQLQSFRFWFVMLSVFALAIAWKLDLFGNRRAQKPAPVADELPPPEADVEEIAMLSDVSQGVTASAPEPIEFHGLAPAPLPPREQPRPAASAPLAAAPARSTQPRNPFGPANPEFVSMPEGTPTLFAGRDRQAAANSVDDMRTPEASPYRRDDLRRTASLESAPPDLTAPRPLPSEGAVSRQLADRRFTSDSRFQRASNAQSEPSFDIEPAAVTEPTTPKFQLPADSKVDLAAVASLLQDGKDVEAHRLMSEWYWKEPQSRPAFQKQIEDVARRIYLQPQPHYMDPRIVADGEMLSTIAKEYDVPWQYLATLNRTDARRIRPGQKLKVIKGPFSAVVDLSDFELTIHAHGYFVKRYTVGIGRDHSSPYGVFKVQNKLTDPTYYGPTRVIEHDDPENPLGEYWLSIGDSFGIHGTIHPDSIGKAESDGCIRLGNEDIAEVYDFLGIGSEVVIRP